MFSNSFFPRHIKRCHCVGMGKTPIQPSNNSFHQTISSDEFNFEHDWTSTVIGHVGLKIRSKGKNLCAIENGFIRSKTRVCNLGPSWPSCSCFSYKLNPLSHYQTTNFRLFLTERVCRRQFQVLLKWQKTLWEKEKLLVTSNFSFSHSVFKRIVSRGVKRCYCVGMG